MLYSMQTYTASYSHAIILRYDTFVHTHTSYTNIFLFNEFEHVVNRVEQYKYKMQQE